MSVAIGERENRGWLVDLPSFPIVSIVQPVGLDTLMPLGRLLDPWHPIIDIWNDRCPPEQPLTGWAFHGRLCLSFPR